MDDAAETILGAAPASPPTRPGSLAPGDAFGLRYSIVKELGAGGMGVVYKAWDDVLGVEVALKMIRLDGNHDRAAITDIERRFKRELLLARQVTHKHVVRIHDLGDVNGTKYITMTYVDGEDLSTILKRGGPLPVERVLRLARQIASGLVAAHDAGVVHRDLKPANIMVDAQDQALIMDFGIAVSMTAQAGSLTSVSAVPALPMLPQPRRPAAQAADATMLATSAASPVTTASDDATMLGTPAPAEATVLGAPPAEDVTVLTPTPTPTPGSGSHSSGSRARTSLADSVTIGQIVGTLDYMSPEQSRGEAVDQRTDIYAFGWILTDLLLGKRKRASGVTPWDAMTARITKPPEPLSKRDPKIPEALDAIIIKCVQLEAKDRYETTHALVAALSRLDDRGQLIPEPVTKRMTPLMATGLAATLIALLGGTWWLARGNGPVDHKPVSVLIADFVNNSNNPALSNTVEQVLSVNVENASFISAFPHRDAMRVVREIKPGSALTDETARLVAMREGLNVTIGGSIAAKGKDYVISVKATNVGDQKILLDWSTTAKGDGDVLAAVGRVAERVRRTLGDTNTTNASSEQETFSASSLDAAKAYAEAQDLNWAGKFDEAIAGYLKTLTIDPNFGRAYSGLAAIYANRGNTADAEANYQKALGLVDRMTEREKLRTRGGYYVFKKNYDKAIEEFSTLLQKYPADTSGMANMAVAEFYKRDMKTAVEMGRRASKAYPNNVIRKSNAALFSLYAGDFDGAEQLATETLKLNPAYHRAFYALGMSKLAKSQPADAITTFNKLGLIDTSAAKGYLASGLIDVALYEGREQDALNLLDDAISMDRAAKDKSSLARRLAIRAGVLVSRGDKAGALRDAREAVSLTTEEGTLYRAGRVLIDAGQPAAATELAGELDNRLENEPRLYGALLRGEVSLAAGRARSALNAFEEAQKLADSWLGRLSLGRAYLALNAFTEAAAEFDRCLSRRGEATSVFLDDLPTYRMFAPVYYYLGRAQEGMKSAAASENYGKFLAIKEKGDEQGLVADARRRVATLK